MDLFEVIVRPRIRMVVRARNGGHARDMALNGVLLRYPEAFGIEAAVTDAPRHVQADAERGLVKSASIECVHCGAVAHREEWGPGWVTCPGCKRHPPTPAELGQERFPTKLAVGMRLRSLSDYWKDRSITITKVGSSGADAVWDDNKVVCFLHGTTLVDGKIPFLDGPGYAFELVSLRCGHRDQVDCAGASCGGMVDLGAQSSPEDNT